MKKIVLALFAVMLLASQAFAQNRQITGDVVLEDGSPAAGVSVVIKGTHTGVITNNKGEFVISAPSNSVLQLSLIGLNTQDVEVGTRTRVNATMTMSTTDMTEVLVTAIGIQRVERSLGYAVSKVDVSEGVQRAEPDLLRSLDGKIPGVVIGSPSGAAGSSTRVTIRGNSSFQGNNQPMYVVDGVPYSNSELLTSRADVEAGSAYSSGISTLDPNDIETMNVLKGAAASVLYGSRAANGVVLITTKSGSKSTKSKKGFEVTFNGSYTVEQITGLPDFQNKFGQGGSFSSLSESNGSWGPEITPGAIRPIQSDLNNAYPNWGAEHYPDLPAGMMPYKAYKNNVKDLFNIGGIYEASLSALSVNDRGSFGLTLSRMKQESYIPGSEFQRFNISVGGNQKLNNGLRIGGSVSYSNSIQDGALYGADNVGDSGYAKVNSFSRAIVMPRSLDIQNLPYQTPDGSNLMPGLSNQANNPYWAWENDFAHTDIVRTVASFNLGYDITDWVSVEYSFGFNDYDLKRKQIINLGSAGFDGKGLITDHNQNIKELESTFLINFKYQFNNDFGLRASIGHNYNQQTQTQKKEEGKYMLTRGMHNINHTKSQSATELYERSRTVGIFADVVLDYRQWLFLNLTGRNDFASTLNNPGVTNNFFYPAVAASFIFTDAFNIRNKVLDFGKFRASWAKVGNAPGAYMVDGTYPDGTITKYNGNPLMIYPEVRYGKLKPEFTTEVELGLEMSFFQGRLGFDFAVYNRNTTDQIAPLDTAPSSGMQRLWLNFGKMNNRGMELGLYATPVISGDFKWNLYGTFTANRSKVKELYPGVTSVNIIGTGFAYPRGVLEVGQPYGMLKGTRILRDTDGTPLVDPKSGMYINDTEEGLLGNPNPKYKTSLTNTFSYKGISLDVMMDYQRGGCVFTAYIPNLLGRGVTKDTEDRYGSRIIPGVFGDPNTGKPLLDANNNRIKNNIQITTTDMYFSPGTASTFATNSANEMSTYDATTFRLREISIGWELPRRWFSKTPIGSINVSAVGRNLWFYAPNVPKYTNYDPTANTGGAGNVQGIDYGTAPSTKRYGFNIKFTF